MRYNLVIKLLLPALLMGFWIGATPVHAEKYDVDSPTYTILLDMAVLLGSTGTS